ncbi:hypothetical protein [Paraburkholderia sp. D1E]|uniref:hypothetical protein n=1 Tax=Paraburkholderia sp. D1E TaxID=3461398 RepID=UPI0040455150
MSSKFKSKTVIAILTLAVSCFASGQTLNQDSPYGTSGSAKDLAQSYAALLKRSIDPQSRHKINSNADHGATPDLHQQIVRDEQLLGGPSDDLLSTSNQDAGYPMTPVELAVSVNPLLNFGNDSLTDNTDLNKENSTFHLLTAKNKPVDSQVRTHVRSDQGVNKSPW